MVKFFLDTICYALKYKLNKNLPIWDSKSRSTKWKPCCCHGSVHMKPVWVWPFSIIFIFLFFSKSVLFPNEVQACTLVTSTIDVPKIVHSKVVGSRSQYNSMSSTENSRRLSVEKGKDHILARDNIWKYLIIWFTSNLNVATTLSKIYSKNKMSN